MNLLNREMDEDGAFVGPYSLHQSGLVWNMDHIPDKWRESVRKLDLLYHRWIQRIDDRAHLTDMFRVLEGETDNLNVPLKKESEHDEMTYAQGKDFYTPNVAAMIADALDVLYQITPDRKVEDETAKEWFKKHLWDWGDGLDTAMSELDRATRYYGTVLAHVKWCPSSDPVERERLFYGGKTAQLRSKLDTLDHGFQVICYEPDRFEFLPGRLDPEALQGVLVRVGYEDDIELNSGYGSSTIQEFFYWDDTFMAFVRDGAVVQWQTDVELIHEHGMGVLPFVLSRYRKHKRRSWSNGVGGGDFLRNIRVLYGLIREYNFTARMQRGQLVISGKIESGTQLGPDRPIRVGQGGNAQGINTGGDLPGIRQNLKDALSLLLLSVGLPSDTFSFEEVGFESGRAIALKVSKQTSAGRNGIQRMKTMERLFHSLVCRLGEGLKLTGVPTGCVLDDMEFNDPEPILSPDQQRAGVEFELGAGLIDKLRAKEMLHPSTSTDILEKELEAVNAQTENDLESESDNGAPLPSTSTSSEE